MYFPAGTSMCMNASSLLRSEVTFGDDADLFRPERFMELDAEQRKETPREVFDTLKPWDGAR